MVSNAFSFWSPPSTIVRTSFTGCSVQRCALALPSALSARRQRARLIITAELAENDTAVKAKARMERTIESVKVSFNTIRTGRANPAVLDRVNVTCYGADVPLNTVATISVNGTSTLIVEPYDKSAIGDIERGLLESDVGMTPNNNGSTIRLAVPQLTQERREQFVKQLKTIAEDGRVALRNIRRDAVDGLKKLEKSKDLGKDESKSFQSEVQKLTDKYVKVIDELAKKKEADIRKV